jgi:hypothetical protein
MLVDVLGTQIRRLFIMLGTGVFGFWPIFGSREKLYFFQSVCFGFEFTCFRRSDVVDNSMMNVVMEKAYYEERKYQIV